MFILKFVRYGEYGNREEYIMADNFSSVEYEGYLVVTVHNKTWRIDNSSNTWNVCYVLNSNGDLIEKLYACPWVEGISLLSNAKGVLDSLTSKLLTKR